jgi:serine/threonine-protein kinase
MYREARHDKTNREGTRPTESVSKIDAGSFLPERNERAEVIEDSGDRLVLAAYDVMLKRTVAVKALREHEAREARRGGTVSPDEAELVSRFEHPSIPPVYDIGPIAGGGRYYSMKFVDGRPLAETRLSRTAEIISIMIRLCDAVAYAHRHGIVHLDKKTENVLVDRKGDIWLIDWGCASFLDWRSGRRGKPGTPAHTAPELDAGKRPSAAADIYGLGVTLFRLCFDRLPYAAA